MALVADILLLLAALAAAFYCRMLALRLKRLGDTDKGLGGAISLLTVQVDEMKAALSTAMNAADQRTEDLQAVTQDANKAARRLELMLASLHSEETSMPADGSESALRLTPEDRVGSRSVKTTVSEKGSRIVRRKQRPELMS